MPCVLKSFQTYLTQYSQTMFWGNPVIHYMLALIVLLVTLIILKNLNRVVIKHMRKISVRTSHHWDDLFTSIVAKNTPFIIWLLSFYVAIQFLTLTPALKKIIDTIIAISIAFIILRVIQGMVTYIFNKRYFEVEEVSISKKSVMKNILLFIKISLWLLIILFVLDNLGFDITTAVAGLGIGGVAIALASQSILGDVFSYFIIFFDKPFEVGDFIVVGDLMGTVEHIGLKTTRIKSLQGEQLVLGNGDMISSRIKNFKKMEQRRVVSSLGVVYETTEDKLKKIPGIIKQVIEAQENATFDRSHFKAFGAYSLDFEYVYYVKSGDYVIYMDVQQAINYGLFAIFSKEGIAFAYPTQVVKMEK